MNNAMTTTLKVKINRFIRTRYLKRDFPRAKYRDRVKQAQEVLCWECGKPILIDEEAISRKANSTKYYHVKCARRLNLI
jgi:hypothetical protein